MISSNKIKEFRKHEQGIAIATLEDLDDFEILLAEIRQVSPHPLVAGISVPDYRIEGRLTLPAVIWFKGEGILFSHNSLDDKSSNPSRRDEYLLRFRQGVPPKAILYPNEYAQYWI